MRHIWNGIKSIFVNDAHNIISQRGKEILAEQQCQREMKTPLNELIKQMSYNRDRALGAEKDAYNICILYAENILEKLETLKTNNKMKTEMEHKNPLTNPSEHTLQELFAELKFGRPSASQEYLDKCIAELNEQEA